MKVFDPLMKPFADKTKKKIDDTNDEMLEMARNNKKFNFNNINLPDLNAPEIGSLNIPKLPSFPKFDLGKIQAKLPNVDLPMSNLENLSKFQISQCSGLMALLDRMELIAMVGLPKLHLNLVMELFCFILELITSSLPIPIPGLDSVCPLKLSITTTADEFNALRESGKGFSFSPKAPHNYMWLIRGQIIEDENDL